MSEIMGLAGLTELLRLPASSPREERAGGLLAAFDIP